MDLSARKDKFVEDFMKITSLKKLKRLEALLYKDVEDEDFIVAYTVEGKPLTKAEYSQKVNDADKAIDQGVYSSINELEEEAKHW